MAYNLKYYAQIERDDNVFRLEILEDGYSGTSRRITTLQTLSVGLAGNGSITDSIIKSQLNFSVVDAPDLTAAGVFAGPWATLYTSDSLKYKVQLKENSEIRWIGYLTPDSYAENLVYRPAISFVARDMLGNASNFVFNANGDANGMITVREVITGAFAASKCPMALSWTNADGKLTENGADALDLALNVEAFAGKNWYEALDMVLEAYGLQLRWTDGGKVSVFYLKEYTNVLGAEYGIQWVNTSGYREIDPSVKEIIQTDDYHGNATIYDGMMKPENYVRDGDKWKFAAGSGWEHSGAIYVANQFDAYDEELRQVQNRVYVSMLSRKPQTDFKGYTIAKRIPIHSTEDAVRLSFGLNSNVYREFASQGLQPVSAEVHQRKHNVLIKYGIAAIVGSDTIFLQPDGTFDIAPITETVTAESASGMNAVVDRAFFPPTGATALLFFLTDAQYSAKSEYDLTDPTDGTYYARVDDFVVSLANGGKYNNFVTTTKLNAGNVVINKNPKIVQAPIVVSPKIITNGIYRASGEAAGAFKWSGEANSGRLSVAQAKQLLNLYYQPFNVLSGSFRVPGGNTPRFDVEYTDSVLGRFVILRGQFNVITGFMDSVQLRQVVPYSSLEITSTSEVGTGGSSVYSSNAGGNGGGVPVSGGGGGSSILDTLLVPHYDDGGNLVSLESTVDFWSQKNISAGGLAAGGGGGDGNVSADEDLASSKIVIGDGAKKVKSSSYSILSYLGDDTSSYIKANSVPTTKVMQDYVDAHSGGGGGGGNVSTSGTWTKDKIVVSGTNNTVKSEYGIELYDVSMNSGLIPTSYAVKTYVDAHSGGGGGYTLPTATTTRLGGVKVGSGLAVADDGTLSSTGGGGTSGITEEYANGRYIRRDGTNEADEKITFVKGIRIGSSSAGVDITYDTANGAVKINGKAYTEGDFSGGGLASGSGDSGVDIITSLSASSTNDQVLGAKALYNLLGNLETALTNLL